MSQAAVCEYITHLKSLIEFERDEQRKKAIGEIRSLSASERERYGRAILNLYGRILTRNLKRVVFRFGRGNEIRTDISSGDVVVVSNGDPLQRGFEGVVVGRGSRYVDVEFTKIPDLDFRKVRVDLFYDDTSFRRMEENLDSLSRHGMKAINLMFGYEDVYESNQENIEPADKHLNRFQIDAISRALGNPDFFIIHGPFGTGKTRTLAEYILQETERGKSVLVTAESNIAIDNIVERISGKMKAVRIGHPSRISPKTKSLSLDNLMKKHSRYLELEELWKQIEEISEIRDANQKPINSMRRGLNDDEILELAQRDVKSCRGLSERTIKSMARWIELNDKIRDLMIEAERIEREISDEIISNADAVLTTNSTAFVVDRTFDVAVVDEASQATVPSILIPLNKAEKFVMAGDHKQLPPVVSSFQAKDLEKTLFEIFTEKYSFKSCMLPVQHRCNRTIAGFPSQAFYGGRIESHKSVEGISLKDLRLVADNPLQKIFLNNSVVFIDTSTIDAGEMQKRSSRSFYNPLEISVVKKAVDELLAMGLDAERIGVISPYDDQVRMMREILSCEVKSVDGFQGREKEVIVISFVRSNDSGEIGFLRDYRRLNVAVTRAKRLLVMVGDCTTLSLDPVYRRMINYVRNNGKIISGIPH